jgi:hypothetical protein
MPAEVLIMTGERTLADYLLTTVTDSFPRAFREQEATDSGVDRSQRPATGLISARTNGELIKFVRSEQHYPTRRRRRSFDP